MHYLTKTFQSLLTIKKKALRVMLDNAKRIKLIKGSLDTGILYFATVLTLYMLFEGTTVNTFN